MKKFFSFIAATMMAMMFTSCNEDQMIGMNLEGGWAGEMYVKAEWSGHVYKASETEVVFEANPFRTTQGSGTWVDYYSNAPWDYCANHIRWKVEKRVISIHFLEDDEWIDIYDFDIYNNQFIGYIDTASGRRMRFALTKVYEEDGYGYNDYRWGWDSWDYYPYYGYSKAADGVAAPKAERPKRMFVAE